jgi:integrase
MGRKQKTTADWIEELKIALVDGKGIKLKSWKGDYVKILKNLPQNEPLTVKALRDTVLATESNTKTRKRACMAVGALARISRLKFDPSPFSGNYDCAKSPVKKLPTDPEILEFGQSLSNASWRYIWGLMAVYGVRPHEAFFCDRDALRRGEPGLRILKGKTGPRTSFPYPTSWILRFRLGSGVPLPKVDLERDHEAIGHSAGEYFADRRCPWNLYQLRHRYAIRLREHGVNDHIAALYMGHSEEVHRELYLRHVVADELQNEWVRTNGQSPRLNDIHAKRKSTH